jgi:hypothetical protein
MIDRGSNSWSRAEVFHRQRHTAGLAFDPVTLPAVVKWPSAGVEIKGRGSVPSTSQCVFIAL